MIILQMGTQGTCYSTAIALQGLFIADNVKIGDAPSQAIPSLMEMLSFGLEKEQHVGIGALIKLSMDNPPKALAIVEAKLVRLTRV